jgi:hypothetical protein
LLRQALPGLLVAVPSAYWVWDAHVRASWGPLGRDAGIFQYVGWAIGNGAKVYRDVRDVNGPLTAFIHLLFQKLGGADEHRLHVLDQLANAAVFALVGACVPALSTRRVPAATTLGFAFAACAALSAQYLSYGYFDIVERESFADLFILTSMGLQILAQRDLREPSAERRWGPLLAAAAAASAIAWFGKPTCGLFTIVQVVALLVDDVATTRLKRLVPFAGGGAVGVALCLGLLSVYGDVKAWARISFFDVPALYRFIWHTSPTAIARWPGYDLKIAAACLATGATLVLIWRQRLPRRALPIALMPVAGVLAVFVQTKGFAYHFHHATAGAALAFVVVVHAAWEATETVPAERRPASRGIASGLSLFASGLVAAIAMNTPDPPAPSSPAEAYSEERLARFERSYFSPIDLRRAANFLSGRTEPDETVQTYGLDPYVLFLAKRKGASPYIYNYDLNADSALIGGLYTGGAVPSPAQAAHIRSMREAHETDMLERFARAPPAAFVFIDQTPLLTTADATVDFAWHCPRAARWIREHMRYAVTLGTVQIWLRNDVAER